MVSPFWMDLREIWSKFSKILKGNYRSGRSCGRLSQSDFSRICLRFGNLEIWRGKFTLSLLLIEQLLMIRLRMLYWLRICLEEYFLRIFLRRASKSSLVDLSRVFFLIFSLVVRMLEVRREAYCLLNLKVEVTGVWKMRSFRQSSMSRASERSFMRVLAGIEWGYLSRNNRNSL